MMQCDTPAHTHSPVSVCCRVVCNSGPGKQLTCMFSIVFSIVLDVNVNYVSLEFTVGLVLYI